MTYSRNPLSKRAKPLSVDVADAIERIVAQSDATLPVPISRDEIVNMLIYIAQTDDDGVHIAPTAPAAVAMAREFNNILTNTVTFQAGYKRYEERAARPVVPVVDYFFRVQGGSSDSVEDMSQFDITQSLPKRRGRVPVDNNGVKEWLRDEETNEIVTMGELSGIVVFPVGSRSTLLRAWLARRANVSLGSMTGTVASIEHARPDSRAVETLKGAGEAMRPVLTRALPKPKTP
jgi:hypothetical protein